jgi:hypothetical protein
MSKRKQSPLAAPAPAPIIPLADHYKALFTVHAERAMDGARPFWSAIAVARAQAAVIKGWSEDLISHSQQFLSTGMLTRAEESYTQMALLTQDVRQAQQRFFNGVDKLNSFYREIRACSSLALVAVKILRDFIREAEKESGWYSDAWTLVQHRWAMINPAAVRLSSHLVSFKLAT